MERATPLLLASALTLLAAGCGEGPPDQQADQPPEYHRDVKALVSRYCVECHQDGGIAPFSLTDYAAVKQHAAILRDAVDKGRMPPWMPADTGVPLAYSRKLRAQDREQLLRWVDLGAPEGDPQAPARTDLPPPPNVTPPRPDLVLQPPEVYMPDMKRQDDYRCFAVDPRLTEDAYVHAGIVRPDNQAIVHHVLVFEIQAPDVGKLMARENEDATPGYTCFGGPGVGGNNVRVVMGWAPGGVGFRSPADVAIKVQKGSMLVMQIHYNMLNFKGTGDRSTVVLEIEKAAPKKVAFLIPLANPGQLKIAAGDAQARQSISVPVALIESLLKWPAGDLTLWGDAPHMHLLGTRIVTSVQDGPVLVDIPRWDFHWQGGYTFETPYVVSQSDTLQLECQYDNSMANPRQPFNPPKDVRWGEGTTDEMCLSFLLATPGSL